MDLYVSIGEMLTSLSEVITSLLVTLAGSFLVWLFRARVSITWGSTSLNFHKFKLDEAGEPICISTEKFYVQNIGRKAAQNIEIVFSAMPSSYNLWPPRDHEAKALTNGNFVLSIPSLAPKQLLIVDVVDIDLNNPQLLTVNCPDAISQKVSFFPIRQFGKLFNSIVGLLMFVGLVTCVYALLKLVVL